MIYLSLYPSTGKYGTSCAQKMFGCKLLHCRIASQPEFLPVDNKKIRIKSSSPILTSPLQFLPSPLLSASLLSLLCSTLLLPSSPHCSLLFPFTLLPSSSLFQFFLLSIALLTYHLPSPSPSPFHLLLSYPLLFISFPLLSNLLPSPSSSPPLPFPLPQPSQVSLPLCQSPHQMHQIHQLSSVTRPLSPPTSTYLHTQLHPPPPRHYSCNTCRQNYLYLLAISR